jgi:hypothetical protein
MNAESPQEPASMPDSPYQPNAVLPNPKATTSRAWTALRDALAAEALADPDGFDRLTGYRTAVIKLAGRYEAGKPVHATRAAPGPAA